MGQSMKDHFEVYEKTFKRLKGDLRFSRLGRTFQTPDHLYFYDTGTGKVFEINKITKDILDTLIRTDQFSELFQLPYKEKDMATSLHELSECIKNENILQAPELITMCGPQTDQLENRLQGHRNQITLELTEQCNYRCKYCIYQSEEVGFRTFGTRHMSFETAKAALDEFMHNSEKQVYVSFYGGEPLLRFDFIKQCISYLAENYSDKEITYVMTTNGSLITEEIAAYFARVKNVYLTISLDGPESIHDQYRVFPNGSGTFSVTMRGLRLLSNAFGERTAECLLINSVVSDYSPETLQKIYGFFDGLEWLPKNVSTTFSYVSKEKTQASYEGVDSKRENEMRRYEQEHPGSFDPVSYLAGERLMEKNADTNSQFGRDDLVKQLKVIHNRLLVNDPSKNSYTLNGCCTPGERRLYVTVEGKYMVCEKIGPSPFIGNVKNGLDLGAIKKHFVDEYIQNAKQYCRNCWAVNLCSACYIDCYNKNGPEFSYRHPFCETNRLSLERALSLYHEILERNPSLVKKLNLSAELL